MESEAMTDNVRRMSGRELMTWDSALKLSRTLNADDADDEMCRRANNLEGHSVTAERRGKHKDAVDMWRCSELFDVARKVLI